ncbi:hypothetical protein BSKO_13990 [Bryopsis sp. KO-2023]|nr:hypothetical protein BSKO_13990 [Bryopsis sp. KO-2023]
MLTLGRRCSALTRLALLVGSAEGAHGVRSVENFYRPCGLIFSNHFASSMESPKQKNKAKVLLNELYTKISTLGEGHPDVLKYMKVVAQEYVAQKDYKEAAQVYLGLFAHKKKLGEDLDEVADARMDLCLMYFRLGTFPDIKVLLDELTLHGKYEKLETLLRTALDIKEECPHWEPDFEITVLNSLSSALFCQRKYSEAEGFMRKLVAKQKHYLGPSHAEIGPALSNLGMTLFYLEKYDEAEVLQREALTLQHKHFGITSIETAVVKSGLATTLLLQRKYKESEGLFSEAIPIRKRHQGRHAIAPDSVHYGKVLLHRERFGKAEQVLQGALKIQQETLGESDPDIGITLGYLASSLLGKEKFKEAEEACAKAISIREKVLPPNSMELLHLKATLGSIYHRGGRCAKARDLYMEVLPEHRRVLGECHPVVGSLMCNFAAALCQTGEHAEAERVYKEALPLRKAIIGETHQEIGGIMEGIGRAIHSQGRVDEAQKWYQKAAEIAKKNHGEEADEALAQSLESMATTYVSQRNYSEAEKTCREMLDVQKKSMGGFHPSVVKGLIDLGDILDLQGKPKQADAQFSEAKEVLLNHSMPDSSDAVELLDDLSEHLMKRRLFGDACEVSRKLVAVAKQKFGEKSTEVASGLTQLSFALYHDGKGEEAEKSIKEALEMNMTLLGDQHVEVARGNAVLGAILCSLNRFPEARGLLESAVQIMEASGQVTDHYYTSAVGNFALALASLHDFAKAIPIQQKAIQLQTNARGEFDRENATLLQNLASMLSANGQGEEAIEAAKQDLHILRKHHKEKDKQVLASKGRVAVLLYQNDKYEEAEPLYRELLAVQEKKLRGSHPEIAMLKNDLGIMLHSKGDLEEAEKMLRDSLDIIVKTLGPEHSELATFHSNLGEVLLMQGKWVEAYKAYKAALTIKEEQLENVDEQTFHILCSTAKSLQGQEEFPEAEKVYRQILDCHKNLASDEEIGWDFKQKVDLGGILHQFGNVLLSQNKFFEAENVLRGALKHLTDRFGMECAETEACREDLYESLVAQGKRKEADFLGI